VFADDDEVMIGLAIGICGVLAALLVANRREKAKQRRAAEYLRGLRKKAISGTLIGERGRERERQRANADLTGRD